MADRVRAVRQVQAEERHELIVDVLIEAAHANGEVLVEFVLDHQVDEARALDAERRSRCQPAERRERPLRRQPRPGRLAGHELLGARRDHALRHDRGNARVA